MQTNAVKPQTPRIVRAVAASAPANAAAVLRVRIPAFGNALSEVASWPVISPLPIPGDQCVVILDDGGDPWVAAWLRQNADLGAEIAALEAEVDALQPPAWLTGATAGTHTASSAAVRARIAGDWLELSGTLTMKNETIPSLTVLCTLPEGAHPSTGRLGWASDASTGGVSGIGIEPDGRLIWRGPEMPAGGVVVTLEGARVLA